MDARSTCIIETNEKIHTAIRASVIAVGSRAKREREERNPSEGREKIYHIAWYTVA